MTDQHDWALEQAEGLAGTHGDLCPVAAWLRKHAVADREWMKACRCEVAERVQAIAAALRAAAEARDKHWITQAQQSFEGVRPWEEMTGGFDDVAAFVIHEIWKRDPRVQAAAEEGEKLAFKQAKEDCRLSHTVEVQRINALTVERDAAYQRGHEAGEATATKKARRLLGTVLASQGDRAVIYDRVEAAASSDWTIESHRDEQIMQTVLVLIRERASEKETSSMQDMSPEGKKHDQG